MTITLEPLQSANLNRFRALLGGPDFGGCFCAVWTHFDQTWLERCRNPAQPNFELTRRDVEAGRRAGYFLYQDKTLIGWSGCGPKTEFPLLATRPGSRLTPQASTTWAIGCIALAAHYRGRGLSEPVIRAIVRQAVAEGSQVVEAYPVTPWQEARRYRGAVSTYRRLGFTLAGREADGEGEALLMTLVLGLAAF